MANPTTSSFVTFGFVKSTTDTVLVRPLILALACACLCADGAAGEEVRYNRDVLPILAENCFACHGFDPAAREAGLRLDTQEGATETAIVPGDVQASELISRIDSDDPDLVMPPADSGKQLTDSQRDTLRRWISEGAHYEEHWAFIPPTQSQPPSIERVEHPIDRFIQASLARHQLAPAPAAENSTLIRRVSLDLVGLPPTPEEIDAFERAAAVDPDAAWRDLIDRLLSSPHYGERWGRWWLDQARYADSNGYSVDAPRSIWKYRDWVIGSLNEDMPFDQFTIEQLAGDLLPDATNRQQVATGFHRNTQINQEGGIDKEQYRIDSVFDRVATTGTVWLGLTIGCAQCHDHKFDPIEQQEFYRFFAFLNNQDEPTIKVDEPGIDVAALSERRQAAEKTMKVTLDAQREAMKAWEEGLDDATRDALDSAVKKAIDVEAKKRNLSQQAALYLASLGADDHAFHEQQKIYHQCDEILQRAPTTMVLRERDQPRTTFLLIKGDFTRPADELTPGTPAVLHPLETSSEYPNRLDLARWITSPKNPLTSRVIVNRIWQQYFGRGLVVTENDFGLLGARPTHPELLDWLAVEFVRRGWSLKEIHRLIVSSHTYRQSSRAQEGSRGDADNRWYSRQERLRLDAELVRDVALRASGLLAPRFGGPPVFPPIPGGVMSQGQVKREWKESMGEDRYRRGLYTFRYRATPPPSLNVFDAPDGYSTCTRRNRSNTPLQSLTLMNDAAFFECALSMEKIIAREGLEVAFRRCTGRRPDEKELAVLRRLDSLTAARALLNLDETITRE